MNITYILNSFPKISETFILDQITGLIDRGYNIYIIANKNPGEEKVHQDVIRYDLINKTTYLKTEFKEDILDLTPAMIKAIMASDIILAHYMTWAGMVAMQIARLFRKPFAVTSHAYDIFIDPDINKIKKIAEEAAALITISDFNKNYLTDLLGKEYRKKINIIRCGVDINRFKKNSGYNGDNITIMTCGRLVEKKGMLDTIRAFSLIADRYERVYLTIVGDGPLKNEIIQVTKNNGIDDRLKIIGQLSKNEIEQQFSKSDIFLLPSKTAKNGDREGLPVAILEAMAARLPVISTKHTGIAEAVKDNVSGFIVEEGDVESIAQKLEILIRDKDLRVKMGEKGHGIVKKHFNIKNEINKLEELINGISKNYSRKFIDFDKEAIYYNIKNYMCETYKCKIISRGESLLKYIEKVKYLNKELSPKVNKYDFINNSLSYKIKYLFRIIRDLFSISNNSFRSFLWNSGITYFIKYLKWLMTYISIIPKTKRTIPKITANRSKVENVLYILNSFPKISETFILNEMVALKKRGINVNIIALYNPLESKINEDVVQYKLYKKTKYLKQRIRQIKIDSKQFYKLYKSVDIVHSHFAAEGATIGLEIAQKIKKPFTITAHAYDIFQKPDENKLKNLFDGASAIITPSHYNKNFLVNQLNCNEKKVFIVRATIDHLKFKKQRVNEIINIPKIISIGRLVKKKGFVDLIRAMKDVCVEYPQAELIIIGNGQEKSKLESLVKELTLQNNVFILGEKTNEECLELIKKSDIAALSCTIADDGDRDVCPLFLQEAMAVGLPVISTDIASIPELITNEKEGQLVPERDLDALAKAIIRVIQDENLRATLSAKGYKKIQKEFNISKQIDCLINIWETFI